MKKEEKVLTNEELNLDMESIQKRVKVCEVLFNIIEKIFKIGIILMIVLVFGLGGIIFIFNSSSENNINQDEIIIDTEIEDEDFASIVQNITGVEMLDSDSTIFRNYYAATIVFSYVVSIASFIYIITNLRKICTATLKNNTPFLAENIKNFKKIILDMALLLILGQGFVKVSLLSFITVVFIYQVFKYGYMLQKEADETL